MIHLTEDRNDDGELTALRAAVTVIEPTQEVIAVLDEHIPGWQSNQSVAWTVGNVKTVDALRFVKGDDVDEYLQWTWRALLTELGNAIVDKSLADARNAAETEDVDVDDQ